MYSVFARRDDEGELIIVGGYNILKDREYDHTYEDIDEQTFLNIWNYTLEGENLVKIDSSEAGQDVITPTRDG